MSSPKLNRAKLDLRRALQFQGANIEVQMNRSKSPRCDRHFNIVAPRALIDAVQDAAARHMTSANAYTRAALLKALEQDGVKLKEKAAA